MKDYLNYWTVTRGFALAILILFLTVVLTGCGSVPGQTDKSWLQMPTGVDWGGTKLVDQRLVTGPRAIRDAQGNAVIGPDGQPAMETVALGCETRIINAKDDESVKIAASASLEGGLPGCPDNVTAEFGRSNATQAIEAAGNAAVEAHGQVGDNVGAVGTAVGNIIKEAAGL